jgi:hypothetical protein
MLQTQDSPTNTQAALPHTWYHILMVRCGTELRTQARLHDEGLEVVCPVFQTYRKIRYKKVDRLTMVQRPILDGYLFMGEGPWTLDTIVALSMDILKFVRLGAAFARVSGLELAHVAGWASELERLVELELEQIGVRGKRRRPKNLKAGDEIKATTVSGIQLVGRYMGNDYMQPRNYTGETFLPLRVKIKNADIMRVLSSIKMR